MSQKAYDAGFPGEKKANLWQIVLGQSDIFQTSFSSLPPDKVTPPKTKIDIVTYARPIHVWLRNYSQEQRAFFADMVSKLVVYDMSYPNPTSQWLQPRFLFLNRPCQV